MQRISLFLMLFLALPALGQQPKTYSCEDTTAHRQFDFWVGNWTVEDRKGEKVYGRNSISKRENGCVLLEEYVTEQGFSGSSINFYNPSDGEWHQHWVDNGTSIIQTSGGIEKGAMVMRGTIYYLATGRTAKFRGRWTPQEDGRVRQLFEERDSQKGWQIWFDGYYRKTD